ncbi:MAG: DNA primase [Pseudomonadota bacterium]|nr:DNA primase [Pseudomonadota bacterium]
MAGLIPQSFIDDLLHRTDIVEVIDKRVPLKKRGNNYTACCPFHNEKTPSFSVNQDRQFYYCFGCGAGGNAIGFVMNFEQSEFPQALETLARDAGLEVPREESKAQQRKSSENAEIIEVLELSSKFYQFQLRQHSDKDEAISYLKDRGVSGEIARDFGLGYAPAGWDNLIKAVVTEEKHEQSLLRAGLIIQRNKDTNDDNEKDNQRRYYDRFRERIIFPIRDSRGRTIAFGGRVLNDEKPKYLNSPETAVFHKGAELYGLFEARKSGEKFSKLLLVEGYMDVIALAQMGIKNAVATLGTATSSRHLIRMFRQVAEVIFCFDGDDAGSAAAWRALEITLPLMEDGRQVKFLFLPSGTDPDTHVRAVGKEKFESELESAKPLEDFFFEKLSEDLDMNSIEGKARLSNLSKKYIRQIPRGVYAQLMLDRLSQTLGVSNESLDQLLSTNAPKQESTPPMPPVPQTEWQPRQGRKNPNTELNVYRKPASVKAIELLLRNPEIALSVTQNLEPLRTAEDEGRKLLLSLVEIVKKDPNTEVFTLLGYCYGTSLGSQLTQLLAAEKITPQEGVEKEFLQILDNILSDIAKKLELLQLKDELKSRVSEPKEHS